LINSISKFGKHKGGYVNLAISQCYMFLFIKLENVIFSKITVIHCNSIKFSIKPIMHIKNNTFCLVEVKRFLLYYFFLQNQWKEMFPCLISKAATVDIICKGESSNKNGAVQLVRGKWLPLCMLGISLILN
jgi:hypothetical protein